MKTIAYVAANAVQDGLVAHGKDWPGVRTRPDQLGTTRTISRPDLGFFPTDSKMPESVELKLWAPPTLRDRDMEELRKDLDDRIEVAEQTAREEMKAAGRSFLGVKSVCAVRPSRQARKPEKHGPKNTRIPHLIAGNHDTRCAAIVEMMRFRKAYQAARLAFVEGQRDVVFPCGTYLLPRLYNLRCHPPP